MQRPQQVASGSDVGRGRGRHRSKSSRPVGMLSIPWSDPPSAPSPVTGDADQGVPTDSNRARLHDALIVTRLREGTSMFTQKAARLPRLAFLIAPVLALAALFALSAGGPAGADRHAGGDPRPTIVLVHGDWADGSSWNRVIKRLQRQGLHRGRAAQPAARTGHRRALPRQLPPDDPGSDRARRPLLRRVRRHQRRHRATRTSRHSSTSTPSCPTKARPLAPWWQTRAPASARAPSSCLPLGEWICTCAGTRTRPIRATPSASPTGSGRIQAAVLAAAQRPAGVAQFVEPSGPAGVEDDPVLVAHRHAGQRDPARAAGADVRPRGRSHHQGQGRPPVAGHPSCPGHEGDPLRGRRNDLIRATEVTTGSRCASQVQPGAPRLDPRRGAILPDRRVARSAAPTALTKERTWQRPRAPCSRRRSSLPSPRSVRSARRRPVNCCTGSAIGSWRSSGRRATARGVPSSGSAAAPGSGRG